ncbi:MAG: hypothetical protein IKX65_06595 [Prevotella sp.]|nr:hypothetical protein [Prevotella sp.]
MNKSKIVFWLMGALMPLALTAQTIDTSVEAQTPDRHWYKISVLTRAMGDSVMVRWAPDEFVPWKYLNGYGYEVVRVCREQDFRIDTLATNVHPISRREFMSRFAANDSLAAAAVQLIFGKGTSLDQTQSAPGTAGSILEVREEQQTLYSFAMLIAEMRPDIAQAMGLMFIDRTAQSGVTYDYIVNPLVPDSILPVQGGIHFDVKNTPYIPDSYTTEITDSVIAPNNVQIYWPHDKHTVYDIERRDNGTGSWRVLNERPYLPSQVNPALEADLNVYNDEGLAIGTYEYRLRAYDAFGLRSNPSAVHRVEVRDLVPPAIPVLDRIEIERPGNAVIARIIWHKDSLEADFEGFAPLYYHEQVTLGQWLPLTDTLLSPTDTMCVVNVTGLSTGTIAIAAYDTAHNVAMSVPMPIRISDVKAPETPQNFRALVSPTGLVSLRWSPSPDKDVRQYEIYKANALDHQFIRITPVDLRDTLYFDTININLNQRYVYYKVKASDWSGNDSQMSEAIAVPIPDFTPPMTCRVDSVSMDDEAIRIWWIGSNEATVKQHRLLRKLKGEDHWTLIATIDADSLQDNTFYMEDRPPYEQDRRYYYAVETISHMGASSGLSMQQSFLFRGPQVFEVPIKLYAGYEQRDGSVRLGWDVGQIPIDADYYYCIYRKAKGKEGFRYVTSAAKDEPTYFDYTIRPGETAEYYVKIKFRDGRETSRSNTAIVTIPEKK